MIKMANWKDNDFKYNHNYLDAPDLISESFYISSYGCPKCNIPIYKTVFQPSEEFPINTIRGKVFIKRVFVCPNCRTYYAPHPGFRLSDNNGYYLECPDIISYQYNFIKMNDLGSTKGRLDL